MNAAVGSIVALVAVGPPSASPVSLLATLLLTAGAVTLKGSLEILVGLSAFWVEDSQPAEWIYSKLVITIGGLLLPLDLFPDWLAGVARALPFASMAYAPARVFVGFEWPVFAPLLLTQLTWLLLFWGLVSLIFSRASRRLVAHGG
jgi:ABC-2 type transport system permease protein